MRLALCGMPGAGKSTLFAALSGRKADLGKAREETGQVLLPSPDERVDVLSAMYKPKKTTYAQVTFLDPAPPAAKADDPATRLPPELRQSEGLVEVVRNFDAGLGAPDVAGDHQAFLDELLLNDLITVERRIERIATERQRGRDIDQEEVSLLNQALEQLNQEKPLKEIPEVAGHVKLRGFGLLTAKPLITVVNNEEGDQDLPELGGGQVEAMAVQAAIEAELAELPEEERAEFMADLGLSQSALDRLIAAGLKALNLISFFTVGEDEVRAWSITAGTLAPQAAGTIHSDMEKGFIRAEVIRYEDLIEHGSEAAVKKAGLMKLAGKDYLVRDGDVFHVRFNV